MTFPDCNYYAVTITVFFVFSIWPFKHQIAPFGFPRIWLSRSSLFSTNKPIEGKAHYRQTGLRWFGAQPDKIDQQLRNQRYVQLVFQPILIQTENFFDAGLLLQVFEEQLDLPTGTIHLTDLFGKKIETVGDQPWWIPFGIVHFHEAIRLCQEGVGYGQFVGIGIFRAFFLE